MTYRGWLKEAQEVLENAGVGEAGTDAFLLLAHTAGIDRLWYTLHGNEEMTDTLQKRLESLLKMRQRRIPVQQITGESWFMGYPFFVNEHVLIPRMDTEILAEQAVLELTARHKQEDKLLSVLDVCTGSGCILLSLVKECPYIRGVGLDISAEALAVAEENKKRLAAEAEFVQSDLFARVSGRFSLIVSNPPYIASDVIEGLMPEVRDHEPRLALDGGGDGLSFYRRIVKDAGDYLEEKGCLMLEIGYDQGEAVQKLMEKAGFSDVRIVKDLAGMDRVVTGYIK